MVEGLDNHELGQCKCINQYAKEQILALFTLDDIEFNALIERMRGLAQDPRIGGDPHDPTVLQRAIEAVTKQRQPLLELKKSIEDTKVCYGSF